MSSSRKNLPNSQSYDSHYSPVQTNENHYTNYTKQLKRFVKDEIKQVKLEQKTEDKNRRKELNAHQGLFFKRLSFIWRHTVGRLGEDWVFLAFLGIIMAIISFIIDKLVLLFTTARMYMYRDLAYNVGTKYIAWISLPIVLILFNTGFVYLVGPQSAGSGLPEMKTILRGVVLKEYLTFKVLIAKIIGLACTIGSGMPLGKEGPLVHMASIITNQYGKFLEKLRGLGDNEMKKTDMIGAAIAVGVATTFGTPIGGVLFSVEVTTAYYAVRNYFRGFFAAVCGALTYKLLSVWFDGGTTLLPIFKTNFFVDQPFDPLELIAFAIIGIICGFTGAIYVWCHTQYVLFTKRNKVIKWINKTCRFVYPALIVLVVSSVTFPLGIGRYLGSQVSPKLQVMNFFSNFTWMNNDLTYNQQDIVDNWQTPKSGPYVHLGSFIAYTFVFSILSSTMPVPTGTFIPVFRIGAAFGRIIGELMHLWFPNGLLYGGKIAKIIPGGYATVGAAAFTGSVTQTISVAVIAFEMTGQITHILPVMIAVLIANAISSKLGPGCYDAVIMVKKLPYLPDLLPSCCGMYNIMVDDFMIRSVKFVYLGMTYSQLIVLLKENKHMTFPLVDNLENMILIGSIHKCELIKLIQKHTGRNARLHFVISNKQYSEDNEGVYSQDDELYRRSDEFAEPTNRMSIYDNIYYKEDDKSLENLQTPTLERSESIYSKDASSTRSSPNPSKSEDDKFKRSMETIFGTSAKQCIEPYYDSVMTVNDKNRSSMTRLVTPSPTSRKLAMLKEIVQDMSPEEQKRWEKQQLEMPVDINSCSIDPAPFQLVERTSLLKVHSLFSLMGLNSAYVTSAGRLTGVVGLKELRKTIEDVNIGIFKPNKVLNTMLQIPIIVTNEKNDSKC